MPVSPDKTEFMYDLRKRVVIRMHETGEAEGTLACPQCADGVLSYSLLPDALESLSVTCSKQPCIKGVI